MIGRNGRQTLGDRRDVDRTSIGPGKESISTPETITASPQAMAKRPDSSTSTVSPRLLLVVISRAVPVSDRDERVACGSGDRPETGEQLLDTPSSPS